MMASYFGIPTLGARCFLREEPQSVEKRRERRGEKTSGCP